MGARIFSAPFTASYCKPHLQLANYLLTCISPGEAKLEFEKRLIHEKANIKDAEKKRFSVWGVYYCFCLILFQPNTNIKNTVAVNTIAAPEAMLK